MLHFFSRIGSVPWFCTIKTIHCPSLKSTAHLHSSSTLILPAARFTQLSLLSFSRRKNPRDDRESVPSSNLFDAPLHTNTLVSTWYSPREMHTGSCAMMMVVDKIIKFPQKRAKVCQSTLPNEENIIYKHSIKHKVTSIKNIELFNQAT